MKQFCLSVILIAAAVASDANAQCPSIVQQALCDAADANRFAAVLTGDQEPAGGLGGASGFAVFVVDRERDLFFYRTEVSGVSDITGAHIHRGAVDISGPVVINLMPGGLTFEDGVLEGSAPAASALLDEIFANPGAFYINVHNAQFPDGAIRGQLNGRGATLMSGELARSGGSGGSHGTATGAFSLGFVDDRPTATDVRMDFDVMTDDVDDMDGVTLREGDEDVADLEDAGGLTNGRLRGSMRIHRDEMTRIIASPSGFHLQFRSPSAGTLDGTLDEATMTFIPAFGRTQNAFGNFFTSDLRLFNPTNRTVNVFIQFFPAGSTNALADRTALIRLDPGQARVINDAMQTLFGRTSDIGSLRVVTNAQIVVDSEIMDDVPSNNVRSNSHNPQFGQFVSGIASCHALTHGLLTSLSANPNGEGFRTNLLVSNPGTRAAMARFELRDDDGQVIDTRTMRVGANAQMLMPLNGSNGMFRNAGANIQNGIVTMQADTPLFLGSSVIRNGSGEARFSAARDIARPFNAHRQ